eukprot:5791364-Amphidinium_carterae.1
MKFCTELQTSPQEHQTSPFRVLRAMEGQRTHQKGQLLQELHPRARANVLGRHFAQVSRYEPSDFPAV